MVDWDGLENRCAERYRGFESHPLLHGRRDGLLFPGPNQARSFDAAMAPGYGALQHFLRGPGALRLHNRQNSFTSLGETGRLAGFITRQSGGPSRAGHRCGQRGQG